MYQKGLDEPLATATSIRRTLLPSSYLALLPWARLLPSSYQALTKLLPSSYLALETGMWRSYHPWWTWCATLPWLAMRAGSTTCGQAAYKCGALTTPGGRGVLPSPG